MNARRFTLAGALITSLASPLAFGQMAPATPNSESPAWGIFDRWDLDKDGTIDRKEFEAALVSLGKRMDANHDGMISRDEFVGFMNTWWAHTHKDKGDKMTVDYAARNMMFLDNRVGAP